MCLWKNAIWQCRHMIDIRPSYGGGFCIRLITQCNIHSPVCKRVCESRYNHSIDINHILCESLYWKALLLTESTYIHEPGKKERESVRTEDKKRIYSLIELDLLNDAYKIRAQTVNCNFVIWQRVFHHFRITFWHRWNMIYYRLLLNVIPLET